MKIVLNVEKKHLIFFGLFLMFLGSVFVIGAGTYPARVGHQDLYADTIYPFTSENSAIKILGSLRIGEPNVGSSWKVGIDGNTIIRKNLRVDGNLCNAKDACISVQKLIDKMEELGVKNNEDNVGPFNIVYPNYGNLADGVYHKEDEKGIIENPLIRRGQRPLPIENLRQSTKDQICKELGLGYTESTSCIINDGDGEFYQEMYYNDGEWKTVTCLGSGSREYITKITCEK